MVPLEHRLGGPLKAVCPIACGYSVVLWVLVPHAQQAASLGGEPQWVVTGLSGKIPRFSAANSKIDSCNKYLVDFL